LAAHSFIPFSSNIIEVRDFSESLDKRYELVTMATSSTVCFTAIDGFWSLASVIKSMLETHTVEVNLLHPYDRPIKVIQLFISS